MIMGRLYDSDCDKVSVDTSGAARCYEEGAIYAREPEPRAQPTRIDIGNGAIWRRTDRGWLEFPPSNSEPILVGRPLTPAEVERAERGLGPEQDRFGHPADTTYFEPEAVHFSEEWIALASAALGERATPPQAPTAVTIDLEDGTEVEVSPGQVSATLNDGRKVDLVWSDDTPGRLANWRTVAAPAPIDADSATTEGFALPILTIEDPNTGKRTSLCDGQTITFVATRTGEVSVEWARAPTPQAPPDLTPEQAARYQDATATTLLRLASKYTNLAAESSLAYYTGEAESKSRLLNVLGAARNAQERIYEARAMYVAYGTDPDTHLRAQAAWRIISTCDATRPCGVYLARVCDHVAAALRGESMPLPSTDDLGDPS
jgi:hypothetical protein